MFAADMSTAASPSRGSARRELARLIEHPARQPELTASELERVCSAAVESGFFGVCVNSSRVVQAAHWLEESPVQVICSVAFPSGTVDSDVNRYETEVAVDSGAQLIELMADHGRLKDGEEAEVLRGWRDVVEAADERPVSIALRLDLLQPSEFERALRWIGKSGALGVTLIASVEAEQLTESVRVAKTLMGESIGVKVEPGRLGLTDIQRWLEAGAVRFGTADGAGLLRELP
jgi:deoxyribose-phosphate aldolase